MSGREVEMNRNLYRRRIITNWIGLALSMAAMVFGITALIWILSILLYKGFAALSWNFFTQSTPAPGSLGGGMANAIVGSLLMLTVTTLVSTPLGIFAGIYLAEYGGQTKLTALIRLLTDVMLSAPSIVIGLFVYAMVVARFHQFSGWAGSAALSLIAIPVVVRTTDNMMKLIPTTLREAAFALGTPRWKVSLSICLRAVKAGVVTGVLLAVARVTGETAPLLLTALNNQFYSTNMSQPIANLPVTIYQFSMSPYENWQNLAWGASLLITLFVLGFNIIARILFRQGKQQH
jgi:phosphate transport system permease protein